MKKKILFECRDCSDHVVVLHYWAVIYCYFYNQKINFCCQSVIALLGIVDFIMFLEFISYRPRPICANTAQIGDESNYFLLFIVYLLFSTKF